MVRENNIFILNYMPLYAIICGFMRLYDIIKLQIITGRNHHEVLKALKIGLF